MKKALIGLISLMAMASLVSATSLNFTIDRPRMREFNINFNSSDGNSAFCQASQRIFFWENYQNVLNFTIDSGKIYRINSTTLEPIYRDWKFFCVSGNNTIQLNSVYLIGGLQLTAPPKIITQTVTQTVTETLPPVTSTTTSIVPTTTTTTSISTTTTTITHTTTTTRYCLNIGTSCSHDYQCCSNDCHSGTCHS